MNILANDLTIATKKYLNHFTGSMKDTAKSQQVSRPFKLNMYEKTSVLDKLLTLKFTFTLNLSIMVNQSIKEYPASNIHKNMIAHCYIQRLQTSQFKIQMHLRLTNPDQNETAYICIKKIKNKKLAVSLQMLRISIYKSETDSAILN